MMVLGIETATSVCGAALAADGMVLTEETLEAPYVHSERLIGLIEKCFTSIQGNPRNPGAIAVSIGPGSFTGLRIGLSVAKGLAYAGAKSLIAVSTLEALAFQSIRTGNAAEGEFLMPMIDARRDEVYTAVFRVHGEMPEPLIAPVAATLRECLAMEIPASGSIPFVVSGDGAGKFRSFVAGSAFRTERTFRILSGENGKCSAAAVALLGERNALNGKISDTAGIEPVYVKEFQTLVKTQHPGVTS